MDPQATWDQLLCAYASGDWDDIEEHATNLIEWLDRGGFPPQILGRSELGPDWDRALARAGCRFALDLLSGAWNTLPHPTEETHESHDPSGLRPVPPE